SGSRVRLLPDCCGTLAHRQHASYQVAALTPGGERQGRQVQSNQPLQHPGTPDVPVIGTLLKPRLRVLEPAATCGGQYGQPERPYCQFAAAMMTGGGRSTFPQLHGLLAKIFPARDQGSQPGMVFGERESPQQAQDNQ